MSMTNETYYIVRCPKEDCKWLSLSTPTQKVKKCPRCNRNFNIRPKRVMSRVEATACSWEEAQLTLGVKRLEEFI